MSVDVAGDGECSALGCTARRGGRRVPRGSSRGARRRCPRCGVRRRMVRPRRGGRGTARELGCCFVGCAVDEAVVEVDAGKPVTEHEAESNASRDDAVRVWVA